MRPVDKRKQKRLKRKGNQQNNIHNQEETAKDVVSGKASDIS